MTKDRQPKSNDARHFFSVGLPLGTVLGVLILGAALQSGPSDAAPSGHLSVSDPPLPPPASYEKRRRTPDTSNEAPPPRETQPSAEDALSRLAQRALADVGRLEASGDAWTSQVGVYCDTQRVTELVSQFDGRSDLYVVPVLLDDKPCFRVCWGHYPDHGRAKQARDVPAALRGSGTFPQRIASVVR